MRATLIVAVAVALWAVAGCSTSPPASPPPSPPVCPTATPRPATGPSASSSSSIAVVDAAAPDTSSAEAGAREPPHEAFTLSSKAVAEQRRVNLYVPPGFESAVAPLPVLYLLDGGDTEDFPHPGILAAVDLAIRTGEMHPLVIVGIENTERRRDMTGATEVDKDRTIAAHVGGSAAFRAFLRDELMPEIGRRVKPGGKTALAGESLAGLFVLETFFLEPALFDTYVAISPSLWWNGGALARGAGAWLKAHPRVASTLYVARAGDDIVEPIDALGAALRASAPRGLVWYYEPRSDLHHADIYETVAPAVVRRLWPLAGR